MGRYTVNLVGESHYQHVIEGLESGSPVKLLADSENPHDPRAVKATFRGDTIGYIERDSWLIRAMHDDRTPVASRVQEITGGGPGEMKGVVLEVRTGSDAEEALGQPRSATSAAMPSTGKPRGCGFWAIIAVAVIFGLVIVGAVFAPSEEERAAQEAKETAAAEQSAMDVTAMQVWQAYEQNEAAAQQAFGDRSLRVTGVVDGVQLGISDEPFVTLETGNMFQSVQLQFADSSDPAIVALRKGNEVTAICTDISEIIGTPILENCVLR